MTEYHCLPEPRGRAGISRRGRTVVVVIVCGYTLCLQEIGVTTATTVAMLSAVVAATAKILPLCTRGRVRHG